MLLIWTAIDKGTNDDNQAHAERTDLHSRILELSLTECL